MKVILFFIILISNVIIFSVLADDYKMNSLAFPCLGCHGTMNNSSIPNISGLGEDYIYSALLDYKLEEREHYIMQIIAKGYEDDELKIISKYFSLKGIVDE
tara:strand:- start:16769 stop:17071 length:303 start_codon:yes stop_codon:yes gene_type:complete